MTKIPLKQAIASGMWLECHAKHYQEEIDFHLKVVGFDRTSVEEIGERSEYPIEGILWLLSVEVVNLCKMPKRGGEFKRALKIIDADDYEFRALLQ